MILPLDCIFLLHRAKHFALLAVGATNVSILPHTCVRSRAISAALCAHALAWDALVSLSLGLALILSAGAVWLHVT
jgi:hypothetical protein